MPESAAPAADLAQVQAAAAAAFNPCATAGVQTCPLASQKQGIGVLFSFHPVLFNRNAYPAASSDFAPVDPPFFFKTGHLLGDGVSEAIIRIRLIRLPAGQIINDQTDLVIADSGWHLNEGEIVLTLPDTAGTLSFREQHGATLRIPLSQVPTGETPLARQDAAVALYKAPAAIAEGSLSIKLDGVVTLDYDSAFHIPNRESCKPLTRDLIVGVRPVGLDTEGYDALKAQWYLRHFGFLAHRLLTNVSRKNSASEWADIADVTTSGKLNVGEAQAARDFQMVARSIFRRAGTLAPSVTFAGPVAATLNVGACQEMALWDKNGYTVEPHHGIADLQYTDAAGADQSRSGRITYNVFHDDHDAIGYVALAGQVGQSTLRIDAQAIDVAAQYHCAIRLFLRAQLIWRLHDADPNRLTHSENVHSVLAERAARLLAAVRRTQAAAYDSVACFDLYVHSGYRSVSEQNLIYARGRTTAGEPCHHPGTPNPVRPAGTCTQHPFGATVTNATGGSSWHNFGMAFDIVFCTVNGQPTWPTGGNAQWVAYGAEAATQHLHWGGNWSIHDWPHVQSAASGNMLPTVLPLYDATAGSELDKLTAVWAIVPAQP